MSLGAAPVDIIRDCAAKAPAEISGVKDLNSACPGLEDALQALGLDRILYDGWRETLSRDALRDVAKLADDYGSTPAASPDVSALAGILKALAREQTPHLKSWWDDFKAWLATWLRSHDADSLSWLDHWLERVRQSITVLNAILYSLIGLVLVAAAWVVVNELRAAGLIARRKQTAAATPGTKGAVGVAMMVDSEPMALADRLSVLLRLLVNRLIQTGRLKTERSLTHRELVLHSTFDSESQRAVFASVAASAESVLYGTQGAAPEHLQSVLQQGQALLTDLPNSSSAR